MKKTVQRPYKRKTYIIKKKFQRNFTLLFLSLGVVAGICGLEGFWYLAAEEINSQIYRTHFMPTDPLEVVLPIFYQSVAGFLLLLIITSSMLSHIIFKRLSVKFRTFCRSLESIGRGDLSSADVCKGSYGLYEKQEEAKEKLNHLISDMRGVQREIKDISNAAYYDEKVLKDLRSLCRVFKNKLLQFKYNQ